MTENKVIDKIKKLLALASSPNENEAQLAMSRAQSLMTEYCIQESKFYAATSGPPEVIFEYYAPSYIASRGLQKELPNIAHTISKIFGCACMVMSSSNDIRIYGFKTNIELTKYTLDSVLNQARVDYKIGYLKARTISFDESFWVAFCSTLYNRFHKHIEESTGITIYDPVRAKVQELSKGVYQNQHGTTSFSGFNAGQTAGSSVSINPGIKAGNQGNLLE